jgi:CheY-like chemotaxis protein
MILLYIDDDTEEIDIFLDALKAIDPAIKCYTAQDGEEALHLLDNITPDLIFLDINMPRMNGKKCLIALKAHPRLRKIPVIMYSTSKNIAEMSEFYQLGAVQFMTKQYSFTSLCHQLRSALHMVVSDTLKS